MNINQFFQRVFVISLPRRTDRRALCEAELAASGILPSMIEWVDGVDCPEEAHKGCTLSHRNLLRRIAGSRWNRVLILEDDFKVITMNDLIDNKFLPEYQVYQTFTSVLQGKGNLAERFGYLSKFLPRQWDMVYLAAGYADAPISRYNQHVIRCGKMFTTSSYGITREFARVWTDKVDARFGSLHPGPIDSTLGLFAHEHSYYVFQPRLAYQRDSKSDITGEANAYLMSMTDPVHENSL